MREIPPIPTLSFITPQKDSVLFIAELNFLSVFNFWAQSVIVVEIALEQKRYSQKNNGCYQYSNVTILKFAVTSIVIPIIRQKISYFPANIEKSFWRNPRK